MKTIASLLLVLCLVSCSQPRPKPKYESANTRAPSPAVAPADTNAPSTMTEEATPKPAPAPAIASNEVAASVSEKPAALKTETNAVPSPFAHPAQPSVPAVTTAHAAVTNAEPEPLLPALSINFQGVPLDKVLQVYAEYVGRTLLRSPSVNVQTPITLVQQTPLTRTEIIHAMDAELAMNNVAMIPIGDKFIKVVNLQEAGQAGETLETMNKSVLPEFGPYKTEVVQLKYTKPSEMVPVLQQFTKTPSAVLPIETSGMLVLRDTAENIQRMNEMIEMLDTSIPAAIESAVIPIKYALASDIASALNSLSGGGSGGSFGGSTGARGTLGVGRGTGQGNARGFGGTSSYGNTAQGNISPGSLGGVGGVNNNYAPGQTGGSASQSFTERVRNLVQQASGPAGKGEFQILGQTKIIADERMNALLVFAEHDDMVRIKDLVKQLDVVLPQVLIEAIIMEVTLDNSRTIGVSAAQNSIKGQNNQFYGGYNNGQQFFPFSGNSGSNGFPGNFVSSLPGNEFSYWGRFGNDFDVAVQAIENDSRVHVLSRPRIQTSHGVEADLFVGETIPYVNSTTAGAYGGVGVYNSYEQQQVGITLKVKPLINPDGLVVMDIYQEASEPGPSSTAVDINGTSVPTINQRQASATVAVKDRDTIILGGMISSTQTKTKSGVPYLKDIPLLGNLFQSTANSEERVELIVLIRPTVLPTPEAAASVATAERRNLPGVRRAEAEIRAEEAVRLKQANEMLKDLDTNGVPQ